MAKILIIQTAFIGDAVLATALQEKLHATDPTFEIHWLVRKGNETLWSGHPYVKKVWIWHKAKNKYTELYRLIRAIRKERYDKVINVQRFAATGLLTALSGAKETIGFDKNPFARFFTRQIKHIIGTDTNTLHETERNQRLIEHFTEGGAVRPRLYPTDVDRQKIASLTAAPYICIAPASVWFTKQLPAEQWIQLIEQLPATYHIYLLGGPGDRKLCDQIIRSGNRTHVTNLCGVLDYLASAALQQGAVMNYVNDSAPLHFASAVNAPVTAVYCSTLPAFGFGPLSDNSHIVETKQPLACRPCGLHGKIACPLKHFNCATTITTEQLVSVLTDTN
ncbi:MAG: glycosyltransferase family 9 protein [Bacteroidota bacterium]